MERDELDQSQLKCYKSSNKKCEFCSKWKAGLMTQATLLPETHRESNSWTHTQAFKN